MTDALRRARFFCQIKTESSRSSSYFQSLVIESNLNGWLNGGVNLNLAGVVTARLLRPHSYPQGLT
ncbi:hypothetical protein ST37_09560 [Vibrio sp. qd031]|nr:hypothetical protein ST37_09560 [Vibrio sp. qd031]